MGFFKPWIDAPELQHVPREDRVHVWREARNSVRPIFSLVEILTFMAFMAIPCALMKSILRWEPNPVLFGMAFLVYLKLMLLTIQFAGAMRVRHALRDVLRDANRGRLVPTCFQCGYLLQKCSDDVRACPECGYTDIRGRD